MLSLHEIAMLMVVASTPDDVDVDCTDLRALLDRGLVKLDAENADPARVQVSRSGQFFIQRLHHR
jgi:hypothetical protein